MMGTERRASLVGGGSTPSPNGASNSAAMLRDFHSTMSTSSSAGLGSSPDRKRRQRCFSPGSSLHERNVKPAVPVSSTPASSFGHGAEHSSSMAPKARKANTSNLDRLGGASHRPAHPADAEGFSSEPQQEGFWRDSRGIAGMVGGRCVDSDRLPFVFHDRPQSEMHDPLSAARRMPPPGSIGSRSPPSSRYLPGLQHRGSSPPPRLLSFAAFDSEGPAGRQRDDAMGPLTGGSGGYSGSAHISPRRAFPYRVPGPHAPFGGLQGRTPVLSHPNPSAFSSYGNPPMIHPSVAGLPGAGVGQGGKQKLSFVSKLYSMLEDPSVEDMISWGPSGTVFNVTNPTEFSRLVLPIWFKHSNWQSFVRQLNMYGFHKVSHSYQGNPTKVVQVWEFRHPSFRRGEISLLNNIKRKSSRQKRTGSPDRSLAGTDLRADRSGGSATSSPEVPLASIPGSSELARLYQPKLDHPGGEGRMEGGRGYDVRGDARAYMMEEGGYLPYNEAAMRRHEAEDGMMKQSVQRGGYMGERGFGDGMMDRGEALARFDDLLERTDAIIRHASFLKSQVRILEEELNDSRAYSQHYVRDELSHLLERLAQSLSVAAQSGEDPTQSMLDVIRYHLSALQPREATLPTPEEHIRSARRAHSIGKTDVHLGASICKT